LQLALIGRFVAMPTSNRTVTAPPKTMKNEGIFAKLEAAADAAHLRSFIPPPLAEAMTNRVTYLLNRCIEAATDTEKAHALAATNVRNPKLRGVLHDRAKRRGALVAELQAVLSSLGRFPQNQGSTTGAFRRGLMDARIMLGGRVDHELVMDCIHADVHAVATYKEVWDELVKSNVPRGLATLVDIQRDILNAEHADLVRMLGPETRRRAL
jgi:uncharacterized protein (TIGR02284 family)